MEKVLSEFPFGMLETKPPFLERKVEACLVQGRLQGEDHSMNFGKEGLLLTIKMGNVNGGKQTHCWSTREGKAGEETLGMQGSVEPWAEEHGPAPSHHLSPSPVHSQIPSIC